MITITRLVQQNDLDNWRQYSHEVIDSQLRENNIDIYKFFEPFDEYMKMKIEKQQAILTEDENKKIVGCIAFSRKNKRITYFCIKDENCFATIGKELFDVAIGNMFPFFTIKYPSFKLNSTYSLKEKEFLDDYGFDVVDANYFEEDVPAILYQYQNRN
jgi:hypothetical protein